MHEEPYIDPNYLSDSESRAVALERLSPSDRRTIASEELRGLFEWILDGSGIELHRAGSPYAGKWKARDTIGSRMIGLLLVVHPELLQAVKIRDLAKLAGMSRDTLSRHAIAAEERFGIITAKRERSIKPQSIHIPRKEGGYPEGRVAFGQRRSWIAHPPGKGSLSGVIG